jgi:hypothetical protein
VHSWLPVGGTTRGSSTLVRLPTNIFYGLIGRERDLHLDYNRLFGCWVPVARPRLHMLHVMPPMLISTLVICRPLLLTVVVVDGVDAEWLVLVLVLGI